MISIKEGKPIDKKDPDDFLFSIEDPFDLHHNPGKTVKRGTPGAAKIKDKLYKAYIRSLQNFCTIVEDD